MQTMLSLRWRAVLAAAVLVAGAAALFAPPHQTAQAQDNPLTIFAIGFVDVAGGDDPNCPGCDGEFGEEDEDFATNNPLPELEFIVKDQGGTEIASGFTEPLANLQRAQIEVPELLDGEEYTLELVSPPQRLAALPQRVRVAHVDDRRLPARLDARGLPFLDGLPGPGDTDDPRRGADGDPAVRRDAQGHVQAGRRRRR